MKNIRVLFFALILGLFSAGCGAYSPVCTDIPLISQRGELQVEGAILPEGNNYSESPLVMRGSLTYGFANHFAAGISADPIRHYAQLTAGTFFARDNGLVWELYAGCCLGNGIRTGFFGRDPDNDAKSKYYMQFVQANVGWLDLTRILHLDIAFSLKAGGVYANSEFSDGYDDWGDFLFHYADGYRFMLEPTAEIRFGWEYIKFNVKCGWTYVFNNTGNHEVFPYYPFSLGAGMSFRFAPCKTN